MAIRNALLNEDIQLVEVLDLLGAIAHVASRVQFLALAVTVRASPLELLHEAWPQSLDLGDLAGAAAILAHVHIFWVVSTRSPAVRADCHLIVSDLNKCVDALIMITGISLPL